MNEWLKVRTFGMPRWAFLVLLAGGITLGLYLRARRKANAAADASPGADNSTDTGSYATDALAQSGDPGLAGVGVVSPPGGVYPVSSPVLPEGLTDLYATLGGVISSQADTLAGIANAYTPQTPVVNITVPSTGGGPPKSPPKSVPGCPAGFTKNTNTNSGRRGQCFRVASSYKGKKGTWHIYQDGTAVKV